MGSGDEGKDKPLSGAAVQLELVRGLVKFGAQASDSTIARFIPAEGKEIEKLKRKLVRVSGKSMIKKIKDHDFGGLDPVESFVLKCALGSVVNTETAKLINRLEVQEAVERILATKSIPQLPAAAESSPFVQRFWDEVGDVTDQDVRELYARLAVRRIEGTEFAINTLGVMRRMDADTIRTFEFVSRWLHNRRWVALPWRQEDLTGRFAAGGVDQRALSHLASVGLFYHEREQSSKALRSGDGKIAHVQWEFGGRLFRFAVKQRREYPVIFLHVMELTTAGEDLVRIVNPQPTDDEARAMAAFVVRDAGGSDWVEIAGPVELSIDDGVSWAVPEWGQEVGQTA